MWQIAYVALLIVTTFDSFNAYPSDFYSPMQQSVPYEFKNRQNLDHYWLGVPLKKTANSLYSDHLSKLYGPRAALDSITGLGFGRARKNEEREQARYSRTLNSLVLGGGFKRSGSKENEKQSLELEESYLNKSQDENKQDSEGYRSPALYLYKTISPFPYQQNL